MSKFIRVTNKPTGIVILQNMNQVDYFQDGLMTCIDGSSLDIQESLEQIEAQLLRDEFARATLSGAMDGVMFRNLEIDDVVEAAYDIADAMLKERLK